LSKSTTVTAAEMAEHDGLVYWVVCRQRLRGLPFEDAVHEGRIGLWRAIQCYDPGRGTKLSTYAVVAIKRSVWEAVRSHQGSHQESRSDFAELPEVLDPSEPLDESLAILEAREELSALIAGLPSRLGEIVVRHHGLGGHFPESFTTIGLSLGVSRQRVHYLHKQALILLAQPDRSLRLRRLFERNTRRDYQEALARKHHQARRDRADRRDRRAK
jgi:RNA polymerase sigma factor (sigma-70 family)